MNSSADSRPRQLLSLMLEEKGVTVADDASATELLRLTLALEPLPDGMDAALAEALDAAGNQSEAEK